MSQRCQNYADVVARQVRLETGIRGPFKSYGKAAFTPLVPAQRLVKGRLVPVK
jgi:hypothetical protein